MRQKTFIPLENNPEVMTRLSHKLGLSPSLSFQDVYSLTDPDLLALIPRPAAALLFIYPYTAAAQNYRDVSNAAQPDYLGSGPDEPVMFYKQTINHACGLIGLLHCVSNGAAASQIKTNSDLDALIQQAIPLKRDERAQLLHDSEMLERHHAEAADGGDTTAPPLGEDPGHAFIAFVKGKDGCLWELEGSQNGPNNLGRLEDDEDVLCQRALEMGPLTYLRREQEVGGGGSDALRFSCTVLTSNVDD